MRPATTVTPAASSRKWPHSENSDYGPGNVAAASAVTDSFQVIRAADRLFEGAAFLLKFGGAESCQSPQRGRKGTPGIDDPACTTSLPGREVFSQPDPGAEFLAAELYRSRRESASLHWLPAWALFAAAA